MNNDNKRANKIDATEELVISTILNIKSSRNTLIKGMSKDYFLGQTNKVIYGYIKEEYKVSSDFNPMSVSAKYCVHIGANRMPDIMRDLIYGTQYRLPKNYDYNRLLHRFKEQQIHKMYSAIIEEIKHAMNFGLSAEFIDTIIKRQGEILMLTNEQSTESKFISISKIIKEIEKNNYIRKAPALISCGNKELDAIFGGGIPYGQITTVAGASGSGKTTLCLTIVKSLIKDIIAEQKKDKVLFISSDMVSQSLEDYIVSVVFDITQEKINTFNFSEDEKKEMSRFVQHCEIYGNDPSIATCDRNLTDVNNLCETVIKFNQSNEGKIKYLIIDYIQLTKDESKFFSSKTEELTSAILKLQTLCDEHGITAILISQLFKNSDRQKPPTISDISDSASIERCSSLVISVFKKDNAISISALKTRQGIIKKSSYEIIIEPNKRSMW